MGRSSKLFLKWIGRREAEPRKTAVKSRVHVPPRGAAAPACASSNVPCDGAETGRLSSRGREESMTDVFAPVSMRVREVGSSVDDESHSAKLWNHHISRKRTIDRQRDDSSTPRCSGISCGLSSSRALAGCGRVSEGDGGHRALTWRGRGARTQVHGEGTRSSRRGRRRRR